MIIPRSPEPGNSTQVLSNNIVSVPRQVSFHVPCGTFLATIRNVSIKYHQGSTSSVPIVRFIFAVQVAGATVDYLAKLELKLDLNEGSELWNVLSRLIGCKTLQECSGKQFDLDTVKGLRCDIEINHVSDNAAEYEFPLVVVTDIQATGTLVACEGKEGK